MADYPINKGIGHSVEFKGLKAQYLFIFAGGLLAVFFLVVVLYMAGADQLVCIGLGLTLGSLLVWGTFHLNNKYGEYGLMKLLAAKSHPRYILNRRNIRKASTLESKFPLLAVEQGCIISKDGDITVAYEVTLPEIFTVTSQEYESVHAAWCKAIKVLPDYSIVHKQDWFVKESYAPDMQNSDMSFLSRSYERHFNERPYLHHQCYLFLTKTSKERMAQQSNFSTLCRGHIIPKEIKDKETVARFLDAVEQFARIINDSGYISLRRLTDEEITGTERTTGLVGKYLSLSTENVQCLEDMELSASGMRIGNKHLCLHTLSQTEDLPTEVSTDNRFERLSTDRSDCRLSFAAPVGLLLSCNHIYNQYVFIDNSDETLQKFEKTARNMHSLSRYSRQNAINKEWIDEYLNEAHSQGLQSVPISMSWHGARIWKS